MTPETELAKLIEALVAFGTADRAGCSHSNDAAFSCAMMLLGAAMEDGIRVPEESLGFMAGSFDE